MNARRWVLFLLFLFVCDGLAFSGPTEQQLARWLERFPDADANRDGRLTAEEAEAYRRTRQKSPRQPRGSGRGAPRQFEVDPGWRADRFPDHAVCYRSPKEIAAIYAKVQEGSRNPVTSYPKPGDGSVRIVGTGHSFMAPGYKTFPLIARAVECALEVCTGDGRHAC